MDFHLSKTVFKSLPDGVMNGEFVTAGVRDRYPDRPAFGLGSLAMGACERERGWGAKKRNGHDGTLLTREGSSFMTVRHIRGTGSASLGLCPKLVV